jgi:xylulose-5-phosphate/fructose-6-phosphate phosphoketolase
VAVHQQLAATLDEVLENIAAIHAGARASASQEAAGTGPRSIRPAWRMIVLRTPKGWTGPRSSTASPPRAPSGLISQTRANPEHRAQLEYWMRN